MHDGAPSKTTLSPEEASRRRFFGVLSKGFLGLIAAGAVVGPLAMAIDPILRPDEDEDGDEWYDVGSLKQFPIGQNPKRVTLRRDRRDAWLLSRNVVVGAVLVSRLAKDECRVLSAVCPHLGCTVKTRGDLGFLCPCHNSSFTADGSPREPAGGGANPSPRGLDPLEWRVRDDRLEVRWVRFEVGTVARTPIA
jgi:menaquinol-cytochrome c reductase iron-sulfur subunit